MFKLKKREIEIENNREIMQDVGQWTCKSIPGTSSEQPRKSSPYTRSSVTDLMEYC